MDTVFPNIDEAMGYVLSMEQVALATDPSRQAAPMVIKPFSNRNVGTPYDCYFNDADDDKFVMTPLQSGRYSLKYFSRRIA